MSGAGEGKIKIGKADVYIHVKGKSNARITHVDIELDELNKIIKPGENSYVGSKGGGIFIGLKKEMIKRAEELVRKKAENGNVLRETFGTHKFKKSVKQLMKETDKELYFG